MQAPAFPIHSVLGSSSSTARATCGLSSTRSTDRAGWGPEPCEEHGAAPLDFVLGGAAEPAAGSEDPELLARRKEEMSPAEKLEKRWLFLEAQTVRH